MYRACDVSKTHRLILRRLYRTRILL